MPYLMAVSSALPALSSSRQKRTHRELNNLLDSAERERIARARGSFEASASQAPRSPDPVGPSSTSSASSVNGLTPSAPDGPLAASASSTSSNELARVDERGGPRFVSLSSESVRPPCAVRRSASPSGEGIG